MRWIQLRHPISHSTIGCSATAEALSGEDFARWKLINDVCVGGVLGCVNSILIGKASESKKKGNEKGPKRGGTERTGSNFQKADRWASDGEKRDIHVAECFVWRISQGRRWRGSKWSKETEREWKRRNWKKGEVYNSNGTRLLLEIGDWLWGKGCWVCSA